MYVKEVRVNVSAYCPISWPLLRVSSSALQLAVRHASKVEGETPAHYWLIATASVSQGTHLPLTVIVILMSFTPGSRVVLEVNRFDRGRWEEGEQGRKMRPTAYIPGDLPIPCEVSSPSE